MRPLLPFFHSFKFKITATVAVMVFVAAIGVGRVSLVIFDVSMRQLLAAQEMAMLTSTAAFIENDLHSKRQALRLLAEERPGHRVGPDQIQALLEAHRSLRDDFYNVTAFDTKGKLIANLLDRRTIGKGNYAGRDYFRDTMASGAGLISAPFRSQLSGKPVVVITEPMLAEDGSIVAILVGAVDLVRPSFSGQMRELDAKTGGYLFIVAADGTIIHHPDRDFILRRQPDDTGAVIAAALASPDGWSDDVLDGGEPALLVHQRLRGVGWTVAVSRPLQRAFAPLTNVRLRVLAAITLITAFAALLGWIITTRLIRPLNRLRDHVVAIDSGTASLAVLETERQDEFGLLSRAFHAISQRRDQFEKDLQQIATTDALTGVHNRRLFDAFFPTALARGQRNGRRVGLAMLDLDKFKPVNDTHGHAVGDAVLVEFARRLTDSVRASDTVARLAGDEFVVVFELVESYNEAGEAGVLGQRIIDAMAPPFQIGALALPMTTSIGIALADIAHAQPAEVMQAADEALYRVKAQGRNGWLVHDLDKALSRPISRPAA
ncbi:UNVERIFIED_ORG: diguanylate cyclase (GGDEF)-like protein [Zoogloea ramigera]|uniref:Diguanylate cyclase n=1 Tax=Duganella zoogloeoides TaxID=75659 RepID=A0ABZ0Y2R3_9BURK|nr:sensor domain-containing diguanylate cyclase [Duganella zoogloeoides]WQH06316.1 diguanylate cyclase [Duganella zoogloeoides]